ncbi:MAG TPA: A24 family peptidase [Pirellulaceae bacterium]|jgi:prepilin peptidase CpaA|nr:A24 family peptidase [Pirellulaceae bacterium]
MTFASALETLAHTWHIWFVSVVLIVAAVIDGIQLKVPNWLTFPMIVAGWAFSAASFAFAGEAWYVGLGWSVLGTFVGLALLLPAYAIGGMGAGDVKLLAGIGAWTLSTHTFYAFCATVVVGAVMAVAMVLYRGAFKKHAAQFQLILNEIFTIRDAETLSEIAAERKPRMMLLPYGIPMCIGTLLYFAWAGLYFGG